VLYNQGCHTPLQDVVHIRHSRSFLPTVSHQCSSSSPQRAALRLSSRLQRPTSRFGHLKCANSFIGLDWFELDDLAFTLHGNLQAREHEAIPVREDQKAQCSRNLPSVRLKANWLCSEIGSRDQRYTSARYMLLFRCLVQEIKCVHQQHQFLPTPPPADRSSHAMTIHRNTMSKQLPQTGSCRVRCQLIV
jgi:hypothetical protein